MREKLLSKSELFRAELGVVLKSQVWCWYFPGSADRDSDWALREPKPLKFSFSPLPPNLVNFSKMKLISGLPYTWMGGALVCCGGLGSGRFWKSWRNLILVSFLFGWGFFPTKLKQVGKPGQRVNFWLRWTSDLVWLASPCLPAWGCECCLCCLSLFVTLAVCMYLVMLDPVLLIEVPSSPHVLELLFLSSVFGLFRGSLFLNMRWRGRVIHN